MGSELSCKARINGQESPGKALLETDALIFRGAVRLSIPFKDIQSLAVADGQLEVTFSGGVASFDLGSQAERWAQKIRSPRGLLDKLGVKPDSRVGVVDVSDHDFLEQLQARTPHLALEGAGSDRDIVFLGAQSQADLAQLHALQSRIRPDGAIWVVYLKGVQRLKESDVLTAAREAGLVDVKVASFSATHTALKLVIPVARRRG